MDDKTLLFRHIHPSFIQDGKVTSQAFKPTPKDEKKLSSYDGDMISPADSYSHYTNILGFKSVGIMSVSVTECKELDLPAIPDPDPFDEHVLIDFSAHEKKDIERKAKNLRTLAESRDWLLKQ